MREFYRHELDDLLARVINFAEIVAQAVDLAGEALLHSDPAAAQQTLSMGDDLRRHQAEVDEHALQLIVRQQPVATDLRTVIAAMRMAADLERMGALTIHIAEIAQGNFPEATVPTVLSEPTSGLAKATAQLVHRVIHTVESRDVVAALDADPQDDEIDRLQATLYSTLLAGDHNLGLRNAMDVALIGRYYERIADHAVSVARCLAFRAGEVTLD